MSTLEIHKICFLNREHEKITNGNDYLQKHNHIAIVLKYIRIFYYHKKCDLLVVSELLQWENKTNNKPPNI